MSCDGVVLRELISMNLGDLDAIQDSSYFLLFASEECKACSRMKAAFNLLYDAGQVPCSTYFVELREGVEMGRAVTGFGLSNLPTLIQNPRR